jgi:hypothetical protein
MSRWFALFVILVVIYSCNPSKDESVTNDSAYKKFIYNLKTKKMPLPLNMPKEMYWNTPNDFVILDTTSYNQLMIEVDSTLKANEKNSN